MLSKALIFCFGALGVFGLLITFMPSGYLTSEFLPKSHNPTIQDVFSASDVVVYNNTVSANMSFPTDFGNSSHMHTFGLPSGQYLGITWEWYTFQFRVYQSLQLVHYRNQFLGWWYDYHGLDFSTATNLTLGKQYVEKSDLEAYWDYQANASVFLCKCEALTTSLILMPSNQSLNISEAWDQGALSYYLSYDVDYTQTGFSTWLVVAKLLTFQSPDIGMTGTGALILNGFIAIPFWALIAYLLYKLLVGLIPLVSGGGGD